MTSSMVPVRCINLDWLEVHVLEPFADPRDATYYRRAGYVVHEREYGTRVYREMFTLEGNDGMPLIEVRRNPASQGFGGIHAPEESHVRLVNRACYLDNPAAIMRDFLEAHHYRFNRISRIDICLDFERFDYGDKPADFIRRYFKGKFAKINQGNIHAHGSERWDALDWNSVSWGAPTSDIGTKLYNKTLELYDAHSMSYAKPYIRWTWHQCGLVDDPVNMLKYSNGEPYTPQIWRLEFSIRSSVKNWFVIELNGKRRAYQSIRNDLSQYDSREKLLAIFASLTQHYFHFKHMIRTYDFYKSGDTHGSAVRKDRCPDKLLFNWQGQQLLYKVGKALPSIGDGKNSYDPLRSLISKLRLYQVTHSAADIHRACAILIESMEAETIRSDMSSPWRTAELYALRTALSRQIERPAPDIAVLLREIKQFLKLNEKTAPF